MRTKIFNLIIFLFPFFLFFLYSPTVLAAQSCFCDYNFCEYRGEPDCTAYNPYYFAGYRYSNSGLCTDSDICWDPFSGLIPCGNCYEGYGDIKISEFIMCVASCGGGTDPCEIDPTLPECSCSGDNISMGFCEDGLEGQTHDNSLFTNWYSWGDSDFGNLKSQTYESGVSYNDLGSSLSSNGLCQYNFAVQWSGYLNVSQSGSWSFLYEYTNWPGNQGKAIAYVYASMGSDGFYHPSCSASGNVLALDGYWDAGFNASGGPYNLTAGRYPIVVWFSMNNQLDEDYVAKLKWKAPGASDFTTIPSSAYNPSDFASTECKFWDDSCANEAPVCTGITGPVSVRPNTLTEYIANVTDPNGDAMTYLWTSSPVCGAFFNQYDNPDPDKSDNNPTIFTSGISAKTCTLNMTATDTLGLSGSCSLPISIGNPPACSGITLTGSPAVINSGVVKATVISPYLGGWDGDESFAWTAKKTGTNDSCSGTFTPVAGDKYSMEWRPADVESCDISVSVSDPVGPNPPDCNNCSCGPVKARSIAKASQVVQWYKALNGNMGGESLADKGIPAEETMTEGAYALTELENAITDVFDQYAKNTAYLSQDFSYTPADYLNSVFEKIKSGNDYSEVPDGWKGLEPVAKNKIYRFSENILDLDTIVGQTYSLTEDGVAIVFHVGDDDLELESGIGVGFKSESPTKKLIILSQHNINFSPNLLGIADPLVDDPASQIDAYFVSLGNATFHGNDQDNLSLVVKGGVVGASNFTVDRSRQDNDKFYPAVVSSYDDYYLSYLSSGIKDQSIPWDFPLQGYNIQWYYEN